MKKWMSVLLTLVLLVTASFGAAAEQTADSRVEDLLRQAAESQKDAWVIAILEAGAREITWEGNTARFFLRGFDPDLKALGSYQKAGDREAWRKQAIENIQGYRLAAEVTFEEDGSVNKRQFNNLINLVRKAAGNAKGALEKNDWTGAMTDLMFCQPTEEKNPDPSRLMTADPEFAAFIEARPELFPCESASEWAPLFYTQRNWKYNVKQGPHSLQITWDGAGPAKLLDQAYDALTATLAAMPGSERPQEDSLPFLWRSSLAEAAVKMKKGRLETHKVTFDVDELISGKAPEGYAAYFAEYTPGEHYERLVEGYRRMPEFASQPLPKTGVMTQAKKGRNVSIKVAKDGRNTYVQLRDADTGVIQAEAFLEPGKNVSVKVPDGFYVVQYASGSTWYGTVETFGPLGSYSASNEFIVAKTKWNLVAEEEQKGITLHPITAADMAPTEDKSIHVVGVLEPQIELREDYPENNPVIDGISSTTGLPVSGEAYTPVVMVLDNAEDAYPHWGVADADIIFQVPNAGAGATKLLGLFADRYPEQAGPARSGRVSMLPAATSFDAAFAFAGPPAVMGGQVDLMAKMREFGMVQSHRAYNLLSGNAFKERWKDVGAHNLSCHVKDIHEDLIRENVEFEERPFLFADEPRTEGKTANIVRVLHRGEDPKGASNSASRAVFKYDAEKGTYIRNNSSGTYIDRLTGETVDFANVIVLRVKMSYDKNYIYLNQHMVGSGAAEIFQSGKYVQGAWVRDEADSRLVLVDQDGSELRMQRGRTFIVITNDVTEVIYTE